MDNIFTILVADRNPHVRDFLRRELAAEEFRVFLAKSAAEVLEYVCGPETIDLLVLDPDLPGLGEGQFPQRLRGRRPELPIVMHGFQPEEDQDLKNRGALWFIEKMGNSVEPLKSLIYNLLPESKNPEGH